MSSESFHCIKEYQYVFQNYFLVSNITTGPQFITNLFYCNLQEKDLFLFSTLVINNLPELGPRIGYADLCHRISPNLV